MYLIKTVLKGTQFAIEFVKNQPNAAPVAIEIDNNVITGDFKVLTKYPVGTLFIAHDIKWGDVASSILGTPAAMYFEGNLFPISSSEHADYFTNYAIASGEFTKDQLLDLDHNMAARGFNVDIAARLEAYKNDESGTLRDRIMRQYPCPTESEIGFHIESDTWFLLIRNIMRGENTLLVGPTGSGKTELVSHIARAMNKPLSIQDMGTVQDAQSALLGVHRLNKDGHSDFDYAPFVGHVQRDGIVLLDEMNRAPISASNILFPCLDKRRYLPIDVASGDSIRSVPVHENCVFFATANLGAEYSGTSQIDRALLDRFFPIELSYPSETAEASILMIRTGIDEKTAKAIVKVSKTIRDQFKEQELSNVVSVRHTLLAASLIKDGFDTVGALMKVVMPLFDDSTGVSERTKVKSIIAAN